MEKLKRKVNSEISGISFAVRVALMLIGLVITLTGLNLLSQ